MNDFIKKYRYNVIWMAGLCFLLFFFLPVEEKQNNMLLMESLEKQAIKKGVAIRDTVVISFKKGLLGFELDPGIKEIRPVNAQEDSINKDSIEE